MEVCQPTFAATTTVDLFRGPQVAGDLALRFRDVQFGGEVGFDLSKGTLDKYTLSVALDRPREKVVLQALTGFSSFAATYYQKFNEQVEVAYKATLNAKIQSVAMEVGAKFNLQGGNSSGAFIKTKLDNQGRLGVAFCNELRPGVLLNLGSTVETTKLGENVHKVGLELTYSA